jgi:ribonuclease HI
VLIISPTGDHLRYVVQMDFGAGDEKTRRTTNNTAEYEGLIAGFRIVAGLDIKRLVACGDSQLVVNQVTKEYDCPQMRAYVDEVRKLERRFDGLQMEHIPRGQNNIADELSKMAARREPAPDGVFIERLTQPSVATKPLAGALPALP